MKIKDYTSDDYIYCYPKSHVLKNKLNIKDRKPLEKVERYITKLRLMDLEKTKFDGKFNLSYLQEIHKIIFGDIYDFAGELRKVELSKGSSQFCYTKFLQEQCDEIFGKLEKMDYLKNLNNEKFVEELAVFIGDLIHLHPFREGNGRAIREFVRQLCKTNGYDINYGLVKPKERLEAEIEAYNCKYNKLIEVLKIELIDIKK